MGQHSPLDSAFKHLKDGIENFTDMLEDAPDLVRLQSHKSVYEYVSQFIEDEFLRRCFSFHPLLVGGNPFDTSSIYAMIHYLEHEWGIYYAIGGTGAIVQAFEKLLGKLGGKIYLNAEVDEILVDEKSRQVQGIRLADGSIHKADAIISNAELARGNLEGRKIPDKV